MPSINLVPTGTTFVSSNFPNTNFSTNPLLLVGTDPLYLTTLSYLQFSLPVLPVASVTAATLILYVTDKTGLTPSPVEVNRVLSPFDIQTVTFNTMPLSVPTGDFVNIVPCDIGRFVAIDVTNLVNQWINGTFPNFGLALVNNDGTTVVRFGSDDDAIPFSPLLVLFYGQEGGATGPTGPTGAFILGKQTAHENPVLLNRLFMGIDFIVFKIKYLPPPYRQVPFLLSPPYPCRQTFAAAIQKRYSRPS
jgi:hypothetical protein